MMVISRLKSNTSKMYAIKYISLIACFAILNSFSTVFAQEIDFGDYSSIYNVSVAELNPGEDIEFGMLVQNEGVVGINLSNSKILTIDGVKYLDVIVDITADNYLLLNGDLSCQTNPSCRIPFTLQAAYANRGSNNTNQAIIMSVAANIASAQFPIRYRGNVPPGPPPTPVYEGFNPNLFQETAYLYIYGFVNVGSIDAGSYTSNVTISISYD